MGDFNAHYDVCHSCTDNVATAARGDGHFESLVLIYVHLYYNNTSTKLAIRGRTTSPNLTFISAHLRLETRLKTHIYLNSDYLPAILSM